MNPNNYLDGTLVGIVVGGDINDPAPDQSCNMKIFIPGMHGRDVKVEHLAFSTMMKSPSKSSQQTFEGVLDPGSCVFIRKDTGSNQCQIIGVANEIYKGDARVPGNIDLIGAFQQAASSITREIKIRVPPQIKETVEGGVKIRKKQEKGKYHAHKLLEGIPSNGAIYPLSGAIIPNVRGVASAVQQFNNILTPALAAALPGVSMSIGGVLGMITGSIASQLFSKMSSDVQKTFENMSFLVQSIESSPAGGLFTSGAKADPETLLKNAVDLLGQTSNITDIVNVMQRIQYDTSLFGQDKLPPVTLEVDTPFGIKLPLQIDGLGNVTQLVPDLLQKAIEAFSGAMSSAAQFPGVNPGENLFGDSAKTMFDMFGRLSGPAQQTAIDMSKLLNQSGTAQKFDKVVKQTVAGGNPLRALFG